MHQLFLFSSNKFNYVVLFLVIACIVNVKSSTNDASSLEPVDNAKPVITYTQKSVKKELKEKSAEQAIVEITPSPNKDDHSKKSIIRDENSVVGSTSKGLLHKSEEKIDVLETVTEPTPLQPQQHQHFLDEDFVLWDKNSNSSESLQTGLLFFFLLSAAAILFIVFKIYRLRLSRAERKYGVQGDRSTQELTPLPISIEDGHSDEEDQTLFEVRRQNIRIL